MKHFHLHNPNLPEMLLLGKGRLANKTSQNINELNMV